MGLFAVKVKGSAAEIDVFDPFFQLLQEFPVRSCHDRVQSKPKAARLEHFVVELLFFRFRILSRPQTILAGLLSHSLDIR